MADEARGFHGADDNEPMNSTRWIANGGAVALPFWGVIAASGDDAVPFLHGQLSNDVVRQSPEQARLAAYCSAQGRVLASFVVIKRSPTELWLVCSADVLATTLKRLSMFVLRSKVMLRDASAELQVLGLAGSSALSSTALAGLGDAAAETWQAGARGAAHVLRLPDAEDEPRWLWIGPPGEAQALLSTLPGLSDDLWRWLDVRSGVAPVVAATAGQFVPQMLNYELVGGVDFKKGCYPGQEIVARSQYLGKLKRRGCLVDGPVAMQPGQEVFWSGDAQQPAGMVAWSAPHPAGGASALVELKLSAVDDGSLHLGSAQGPLLTRVALPYALPQEAENGRRA